ncbi:MAG: family 20 glycosylhydrolase [Firmicutes bacterium]|nr:family 20 glycosylhydrolase [Bacillota bacterium]
MDAPAFSHRGLLLDCARHFFPAEEIRRVLEAMALCELNVFHWHLADDQGFRIETKAFPEINEAAGPYDTQAEIRDLVAYTADRGIEVIPEIDLPGHTRAILAGLPKLSCSGKRVRPARTGGIYKTILCPGKEEVFRFLSALFDEICPLFPSALISHRRG